MALEFTKEQLDLIDSRAKQISTSRPNNFSPWSPTWNQEKTYIGDFYTNMSDEKTQADTGNHMIGFTPVS